MFFQKDFEWTQHGCEMHAESMQIGRYGKGCFYNTHNDGDGTTLYNYPDNKWIHKKKLFIGIFT